MSEYNKDLDKCVKDCGVIPGTEIHVELRSYDGGKPKISVFALVGKNKDKTRQMFRIEEAEALIVAKFLLETFPLPTTEPVTE